FRPRHPEVTRADAPVGHAPADRGRSARRTGLPVDDGHPDGHPRGGGDREADPGGRRWETRRRRRPRTHPRDDRRSGRRARGQSRVMTDIAATAQPGWSLKIGRGGQLLGLVIVFLVAFFALRGTWTLPHKDDAPLFVTLNGVRDW